MNQLEQNSPKTPKKLQTNLEIIQKRTFLTTKWSKVIPSRDRMWHDFFIFECIYQLLKNTEKSRPLKTKNNGQTPSKQLPNNFEKIQKTGVLTQKIVKMILSEGKYLTKYFDFERHLSTFHSKNLHKSEPVKSTNIV